MEEKAFYRAVGWIISINRGSSIRDALRRDREIIDLGPEGGEKGGTVVATGTPENVMLARASYTGQYLRKYRQ